MIATHILLLLPPQERKRTHRAQEITTLPAWFYHREREKKGAETPPPRILQHIPLLTPATHPPTESSSPTVVFLAITFPAAAPRVLPLHMSRKLAAARNRCSTVQYISCACMPWPHHMKTRLPLCACADTVCVVLYSAMFPVGHLSHISSSTDLHACN